MRCLNKASCELFHCVLDSCSLVCSSLLSEDEKTLAEEAELVFAKYSNPEWVFLMMGCS